MAIARRQILILIWLRRRLKRKALQTRKKRRYWVRKICAVRCEKGEYYQLVKEMKLFDIFQTQDNLTVLRGVDFAETGVKAI